MTMLDRINFFLENWYVLTTFACALILSVVKLVEFIGYPTEKKKEEILHRLLIYVTEAEENLGSSTGELKLSQTYDYFCNAFPYTKKWISYNDFADMVDEVLPTMRDILKRADEL